ncbi:hypothetical protein SAMN06295885_0461 [Rathayibacter oskolensis]|uniref:Ribbon-helix-helix protein, copG family n=1 Tax=Rathayibacter oskolensis TaxID=1891671 RepID=A0A1X7N0C9_9MICO|nr:hypothetical protein [Rathayibacter oskolensis]SMH30675.1 hypothetical protein SAMN06295885_0461 [Rathayibacter oskolensis]
MPTGRPPKNYVTVRASIPTEMDKALDAFVAATGLAKASLIRIALAEKLVALNLLPDHPPIPLSLTSRPNNE